MSLLLLLLLGVIPSIIFWFLSNKKPEPSALLLTWSYLLGWAMFMELSYEKMRIWYWIPESSVGFFLGRPIEDFVFATILVTAPVMFYLWLQRFLKKSIKIGRQAGASMICMGVGLVFVFSILNLSFYTRYLPIFSLLIAGFVVASIKKMYIHPKPIVLTTIVTLGFCIVWNNLAKIYSIWGWYDKSILGHVLGMPIDEIFFVFFLIPAILIIYQGFESVTASD